MPGLTPPLFLYLSFVVSFVVPGPPLEGALSRMLENRVLLVDKARDKACDKVKRNGPAPHHCGFSAESSFVH